MRRVLAIAPIALSFVLLAGCDKDKPKEEKKSEATPVPSDMVFNDFLPQNGGSANGLGVRDAGTDGALAAVNGGDPAADPGAGSAGASPSGGPAEKLTVTDPGADPKALRKYNFVANRVDRRLLTLTQSMAQSMGGQTTPPQEQVLKMYLDLTPKAVKPASSTIEVKLTKIEIPGAPPQAVPMLASLNGLTGAFEASARGDAGEVQFAGTPQMQQNQLAEPVIGGLSQAVQLLLAPFPDAPIGVGAKWELPHARPDQPDQGAKRFTLKELTADGAVVEAELEVKVAKHQQPGQRGQPPMTVEVDGKGKYTYQIKFDHLTTKVEGELTVNEKIEGVDPRSGQKMQITRIQKAKHLLETATK